MGELLLTVISEFKGSYPDVPIAEGVDIQALTDGDPKPFFVTLPIAEIGAVSTNGRLYDREAVESIVRTVNEQRPGGNRGHIKPQDRPFVFDLPRLMWVGAVLEQDGKAWAKTYVPTYASDEREYYRSAMARRSSTATSIYGTAGSDGKRVRNLIIESIDMADPSRAGVAAAVAVPHITSEMEHEDKLMGELNEQLLSEMKAQRDEAQTQVAQARAEKVALEQRVKELESAQSPLAQARAYVTEMAESYISMGINVNASGVDLEQVIREMTTKLMSLQAGDLIQKINAAVTEMVLVEDLRPFVSEMLIDGDGADARPKVKTVDEAKAKITAYLSRDSVKALAQKLVSEQAGPEVFGGPTQTKPVGQGDNWRDSMAAGAADLAKSYGV